jgi:hypothetical protein
MYTPTSSSGGSYGTAFHKGKIYGDLIPNNTTRYELFTNNPLTAQEYSALPLNTSEQYQYDPWFLHSTYTSFENLRVVLKEIIAVYGTGNVLVANYVPIDYGVLPEK